MKHNSLIGSYELGGLKYIDVTSKINAFKLSWIKRLFDESEHSWEIIPNLFLSSFSRECFFPNLKVKTKDSMPVFYKHLIKGWEDISKCDPQRIKSVLSQPMMFNAFILIGNKPISWRLTNVCFVMDLYDHNGNRLEWTSFKTKYNLENTEYFKWRQIVNAILNRWKIIISNNQQFGDFSVHPKQHLLHLTRMLTLDRLTSK